MSAHCDVLRRAARGVFGAMAAVAVVCFLPAATDAGTSAPASGSLAYGADAQHLNVQIVNGQASGSTPWNWVDLRINGVMITGLNIGGFPSCQTYPNGSAACGG